MLGKMCGVVYDNGHRFQLLPEFAAHHPDHDSAIYVHDRLITEVQLMFERSLTIVGRVPITHQFIPKW